MPETKIRINGLPYASSAELTDRYAIDDIDGVTQSVSGQDIADMVGTEAEFSGLDSEDKTLVGAINEALQGGGGGGSTVTITPTLSTGTKIADYSIDDTSGSLYAPTGGGGGSNVFTITKTAGVYDKTAQEIYDAISAKTYSFVLVDGSSVYYSTKAAIKNATEAAIYFDSKVTDTQEGSGTQTVVQTRLDIDTVDGVFEYLSLFESIKETMAEATLTAGQTSVTFSNCYSLSANSTIDVYTTVFGVNPTNIVADVSAHTITVTFGVQASDLGVKVRYS